MLWSLLILSLPTTNTAARMKAWRALKAAGAAVLRDGVYALPDGPAAAAVFDPVATEVQAAGGEARLLQGARCEEDLAPLFDRSAAYADWLAELNEVRAALAAGRVAELPRSLRRLRRGLEQCVATDFFPGEPQRQALQALQSLEEALAQQQSPGEPRPRDAAVPRQNRRRFQGRTWVTRERPWVDRLACAWLIRRFIDPAARLLWLEDPAQAPRSAVGYDFDGATFSHVGARVSFETLLAAFELETPALLRLGQVVHALDAGGAQPPEAAGVERVLAGMRQALADDDALALAAAGVFEGLHQAFEREAQP